MDNRWQQFEEQMRTAQAEVPPTVDVVASVAQRIEQLGPMRSQPVDWAILVLGSASVATAAGVLIATVLMWQGVSNPLAGLFAPIDLVMR